MRSISTCSYVNQHMNFFCPCKHMTHYLTSYNNNYYYNMKQSMSRLGLLMQKKNYF